MYSRKKREQAARLRRQGHSLNEISRELGIAKSTASAWCRDVRLTKKGKQRLSSRTQLQPRTKPTGGHVHARRRALAFQAGRRSKPVILDAVCVGLYWGDGNKWKRTWKFINSERDTVKLMIGWAIRATQPVRDFRAVVIVHDEDGHSDESLRRYWSKAGIPRGRISVTRVRKQTKKKHRGKLPYGTCHLSPIKNGAWLFSYYEGQRDAITKSAG